MNVSTPAPHSRRLEPVVRPTGRSVGLDATPEMLEWPRSLAPSVKGCVPEFVEGSAEHLPFEDRSFDLVISNGILNLSIDKDRAFVEMTRVLAPSGEMVVAENLIVRETIPEDLLLKDPDGAQRL